jgi:trans-aconitate methyltransferase
MQPQTWCPDNYATHASFVSSFGVSVVDLLAVRPGERILDLGCGEGALAEKLRSLGAEVVGVDSSAAMVEATRAKGISAYVMSGDALTFTEEFDAVFSNAALHWIPNYRDVVRGVSAALKPGGRFVGEFGGDGNIKCIVSAIERVMDRNPDFGGFENPWFFPSADSYAHALREGGFHVELSETFPRPTPLTTGLQPWLKIFADHVIAKLSEDQVTRFLDAVENLVRPSLFTTGGGWVADYVRLRFSATKPRVGP